MTKRHLSRRSPSTSATPTSQVQDRAGNLADLSHDAVTSYAKGRANRNRASVH